jgi:hypothetical protein
MVTAMESTPTARRAATPDSHLPRPTGSAGAAACLTVLIAALVSLPALAAVPAPAKPPASDASFPPAGDQAAAGSPASPDRVLDVTLVSPTASAPVAPSGHAAATPGVPTVPQPGSAAPPTARGVAVHRPASSSGSSRVFLALGLVAIGLAVGRLAWRYRPRRCPRCGERMRRLEGADAFAELDMAERTDHLIGEVRYRVWRCPSCGAVAKSSATREVSAAVAAATAPPVGSAIYQRRHTQSGLSFWSPPTAASASSAASATPEAAGDPGAAAPERSPEEPQP